MPIAQSESFLAPPQIVTPQGATQQSATQQGATQQVGATSAAVLQDAQFTPLRTIIPGLITEGVSLLVGRPKFGKSWLVLDLCLAIATGRPALGGLTPATGDALYLALEDGYRRLHRRMATLLPDGERWPARLGLTTQWRRANEGGVEAIRAWCQSVTQPVAVVIDTLERFRARRGSRGGRHDYDTLAALQQLAIEQRIAIVVVHHARKTDARDPFDTVAGTQGLSGVADTVMVLKQRDRAAVLHVRSRDVEDSQSLMTFDPVNCRWVMGGAAPEPGKTKERTAIIDVLAQAAGPMKVKDIAAATGSGRAAIDTLLSRMVADREIVRLAQGHYGSKIVEAVRSSQ